MGKAKTKRQQTIRAPFNPFYGFIYASVYIYSFYGLYPMAQKVLSRAF